MAIAYEAHKYPNREVGGDLYGLWNANGSPVVFLATGPGKKYKGYCTTYEMDVEYMQACEKYLMANFGIQYLGDWHSHHMLNLDKPSIGDRERIYKLMDKNKIGNMAEIIVTHLSDSLYSEKINSFVYVRNNMYCGNTILLNEQSSPVRELLLKSLDENRLFNLGDGYLEINKVAINVNDSITEGKSNEVAIIDTAHHDKFSEPVISSETPLRLKL